MVEPVLRRGGGRAVTSLRRAGLLAIGAVAFLATASGVRALLPWPSEGSLDARWRHFRAHADDYDLVFLGSSTVARGVDPQAFDRTLARLGRPLRSYNLAADNMQSTEAGHMLRQIRALRPERLRFVVIELLEFAPRGMVKRNAFSERAVYWHDAAGLVDALRRVAASDETRRERLRLAWVHVQHAAWRASNFGRAESALATWRAGIDPADAAIAAAGGFEALDDRPDPASLDVHRKFRLTPQAYLGNLEEVDRRNRVPGLASPALLAAVREQTAWLRSAGIEPIYAIPPQPWAAPELLAIGREPGVAPVIALNSPGRYPELFDPANRWDGAHVNRAGAALLSERLAEAVAPVIGSETR